MVGYLRTGLTFDRKGAVCWYQRNLQCICSHIRHHHASHLLQTQLHHLRSRSPVLPAPPSTPSKYVSSSGFSDISSARGASPPMTFEVARRVGSKSACQNRSLSFFQLYTSDPISEASPSLNTERTHLSPGDWVSFSLSY